MKNGIINTQNNENVLTYNSSDNISYNDIKLTNYLPLLRKEITNYIVNQKNYKIFQLLANHTIATSNTYENLTQYTGTFAGRKNTLYTLFSLNNDNFITFNENCPRSNVFTTIKFNTQVFANGGTGNKYVNIQIIRNNEIFDTVNKSVSTYNSGERQPLNIEYGYIAQQGDIIKLGVYGTAGDLFQNSSVEIESQPILRDTFEEML